MSAQPRYAVARRHGRGKRPAARSQHSRFTPEEILDAIRRWNVQYGAPPKSADWDPSRAERHGHSDRAARFRNGDWPSVRMVRRQFGTFGAAITAAGFDAPAPTGTKPKLDGPEEVLRAIRAWTRRYGEPPSQSDWDPARARAQRQEWRVTRYCSGDWPSLATARASFGTLGAAVRAAGVEPAPRSESGGETVDRRLRNAQQVVLRDLEGPGVTGPGVLAESLRRVSAARGIGDEVALRAALMELASNAARWATTLPWAGIDQQAEPEANTLSGQDVRSTVRVA